MRPFNTSSGQMDARGLSRPACLISEQIHFADMSTELRAGGHSRSFLNESTRLRSCVWVCGTLGKGGPLCPGLPGETPGRSDASFLHRSTQRLLGS